MIIFLLKPNRSAKMPDPDRSCKLALTKSSGKYYTSVAFAICRGENDAQVGAFAQTTVLQTSPM